MRHRGDWRCGNKAAASLNSCRHATDMTSVPLSAGSALLLLNEGLAMRQSGLCVRACGDLGVRQNEHVRPGRVSKETLAMRHRAAWGYPSDG